MVFLGFFAGFWSGLDFFVSWLCSDRQVAPLISFFSWIDTYSWILYLELKWSLWRVLGDRLLVWEGHYLFVVGIILSWRILTYLVIYIFFTWFLDQGSEHNWNEIRCWLADSWLGTSRVIYASCFHDCYAFDPGCQPVSAEMLVLGSIEIWCSGAKFGLFLQD